MKKKWFLIGGVVGISSIVMVTTGFSALASTTGYDTYKAALKNTKTVANVSVRTAATLQDNGNALANMTGSFKVNTANHSASGSADVTANNTRESLTFFKQNDQTVLKSGSSDVYFVSQDGKERHKKTGEADNYDAQMSQQVETVIDALVGNLKDYVAVNTNADGSKAISVQLDNTQIPAVVNAIAPIAIKQATKKGRDTQEQNTNKSDVPFQKDLFKNIAPQLTQAIKIENVSVKATVSASNLIEHQEADITVSGKDDNGTAHRITVHVQADLSGFNNTTPDTIDLSGKTVQTLKRGHEGRFPNNQK